MNASPSVIFRIHGIPRPGWYTGFGGESHERAGRTVTVVFQRLIIPVLRERERIQFP